MLLVVNPTSCDILAPVAGIPLVGGDSAVAGVPADTYVTVVCFSSFISVSAVAGLAFLLFLASQHRYCS
jgi:hypothetical protein